MTNERCRLTEGSPERGADNTLPGRRNDIRVHKTRAWSLTSCLSDDADGQAVGQGWTPTDSASRKQWRDNDASITAVRF